MGGVKEVSRLGPRRSRVIPARPLRSRGIAAYGSIAATPDALRPDRSDAFLRGGCALPDPRHVATSRTRWLGGDRGRRH